MVRRRRQSLAFGCLLGLLAATSLHADEPRAEVFFTPNGPIGREEAVQLTVRISAAGQVEVTPPALRLENLQQVQGPSQANSIQFVNGSMSQTISYTYLLSPRALGRAKVLPFKLRVNGKEVEVRGAETEIVENPPPRQARRNQDPFGRLFGNDPFRDPADDFFNPGVRRRQPAANRQPQILLEAVVDEREPWLGEQLIYTLYLVTEVNVRSVTPTEVPDFKGFWNEQIPQSPDDRTEMIERDGRSMGRIAVLERALFPRQAGRVEIEPLEATMTAILPDPSSFGLMPIQRVVTRKSEPVLVQVKPLPPGAPANFSGLVGQVQLRAKLDRETLEVGEAATLTLTLEGKGHLQGLAAPELAALPGLKAFPPQQSGGDTLRNRVLTGERVWSYVLVPERPGRFELPAVEIPYFDPAAGQYKIARGEKLSFTVAGASRAISPTGSTVELHPIRPNAMPAALVRPAALPGPALLAAVAPWLALLLLWVVRRSGGSAQKTELRRAIERKFTEAAAEKRPRPCAALLEDAWRQWLEQRYEIAPNVPSTQWRALLTAKGLRNAEAEQLVSLADDLHYLRYAPELSSTDDLRLDLVERSRRLLKSLS